MKNKREVGIIIFGPVHARGGITTVVRSVLGEGIIQRHYKVFEVNTSLYKEGNLFKELVTFLTAIIRTMYLLIWNERIEILHIHSSSGPSFYRKAIIFCIGIFCSKRTIFHLHASHFIEYFINSRNLLVKRVFGFIVRKANTVVVLSESWEKAIRENYNPHRVHVIRNPISVKVATEFTPPERTSKDILFLGFFIKSKGVYDLIKAMVNVTHAHKDAQLLLCGKGEEEEGLRKEIRALNLHDNVKIIGWVEQEEKAKLLKMARVFVLPSYKEGMPMALLEALAFGVPVVATKVGAIPEILEEGHNGLLVEPGDINNLSDKLILLLENLELNRRLRQNSIELAKKFQSSEIAKKWVTLYKGLLTEKVKRV